MSKILFQKVYGMHSADSIFCGSVWGLQLVKCAVLAGRVTGVPVDSSSDGTQLLKIAAIDFCQYARLAKHA